MIDTKTAKGRDSLILNKLPAYFLVALILYVGWLLYVVVEPFVMILLFSAIVATVTFPIYDWVTKLVKGRRTLAAVITCLLVVFAIIVPIVLFLLLLVGQAVDLYQLVNNYLQNVDFGALLLKWQKGNLFYDLAGNNRDQLLAFIQQNMEGLKTGVAESAKYISSFAAKQSAKMLADVGYSLFNLLFMFFTLFFLYRDGRYLLYKILHLSPIPMKYEKELCTKFLEISKATLFGTFLTAVAQGMVAWIGFWIAGVPSAFFWGTAVSLFSLVPTVGTALVWFPMGVIMLAGGDLWGIFVLIWGFTLVSTVDNVLRVIFIGSSAKLNPLLTFVSVFGGILAFGLIGVVLGPMILVLFMTLLHVYEMEYAYVLKE